MPQCALMVPDQRRAERGGSNRTRSCKALTDLAQEEPAVAQQAMLALARVNHDPHSDVLAAPGDRLKLVDALGGTGLGQVCLEGHVRLVAECL